MVKDDNLPVVLCRYQSYTDVQFLLDEFHRHFTVITADSDECAKRFLDQENLFVNCLIVTQDSLAVGEGFGMLLHPAVCGERCMKILLYEDLSVELVRDLLEHQVVDGLISRQSDPDLLRSKIFQYTLARNSETPKLTDRDAASKPVLLVVDDETHATKYLKKQLEISQSEFSVYCADCAREALAILERPELDVAVLLTDQRMPDVNGRELLKQVRKKYPNTVRMLTSAYGEVDVAVDAVNEEGLFRYITKPWRSGEVIEKTLQAIQFRRSQMDRMEKTLIRKEATFLNVIERRKNRIHEAFERVFPQDFSFYLDLFFDLVSSVEVLDPGVSVLDADELNEIESELVDAFVSEVRKQYYSLQPIQKYSEDITRTLLQRLLGASLLDFDEMNVEYKNNKLRISNPKNLELNMYAHLMGPVKRVSSQLLAQQASLFLLLALWNLWQGDVQFKGRCQAYDLCLIMDLPSAKGECHG
ncbi:MAG: hypothetical protein CMK89_05830 [Pseudomonadales bacterium]|nr:hypothetical protein [Pseudomonadales bacterium]